MHGPFLTDHEKVVLARLSKDKWKFPGRGETAALKNLDRLGYAVSDLMEYSVNRSTRVRLFKRAYKLT